MTQRLSMPIIAVLAFALALASFHAAAGSRPSQLRPATVIATVNFDAVLQSLDEFKVSKARLEELGSSVMKGLDDLRQQLQKNKDDLDNMKEKAGTPEYQLLLAKRVELIATYKGREGGSQQMIDEQGGTKLRDMYVKVLAAVARYAAAEGIDLVLRDDSDSLPPAQIRDQSGEMRPLTRREIRSFVDQRSILVGSKKVDITTDIATLMNNEFRAGGGK